MFFGISSAHDYSLFATRRADLLAQIKQQYPTAKGVLLLMAGFEEERVAFRQESTFFYLTGINEPGAVLLMDLEGKTTLLVPDCGAQRSTWVASAMQLIPDNAKKIKVDQIVPLGALIVGYQLHPFSPIVYYEHLIKVLQEYVQQGAYIFTLNPNTAHEYVDQRFLLIRLASMIPNVSERIVDVSTYVARMRRHKDMSEIESLYKAVEITIMAQEAAAHAIEPGITEAEVQASLEYMMTGANARPAFPSIVGSGANSTVLHYTQNSGTLTAGDLVVVDIGAEYELYAADITRTYPVSGVFTKRQKEIYNIVLQTQEYIASQAKAGMWLKNKNEPQKSLHHLAQEFLRKKGYDQYFPHGIGHFLGLDVHDVGDYAEPLHEGDVFTIEPGIYIPQEKIGIRIEDDYWVMKDGVICLSEALPKSANEIEALVQSQADDFEDTDEDGDDLEH